MGIPQILIIILFTIKVIVSLYEDDKEVKVSFFGSVFWVIIYSIILYYGDFWG